MLLHQVVLRQGLPFEARIPNKETRAAIAEIEDGAGETFAGSAAELFENRLGSRKQRRA